MLLPVCTQVNKRKDGPSEVGTGFNKEAIAYFRALVRIFGGGKEGCTGNCL